MPTAEAPKIIARLPKYPKKELDSREFTPNQKPTIEMPPIHETVDPIIDVVQGDGLGPLKGIEALAFNEEPVTILIHRGQEAVGNKTTDFIANQGIPAEMLFRNGWVPMGYLPRGVSITVKRKTVEQLATAKMDKVHTQVIERDKEDPRNFLERNTIAHCPFTLIADKNPRSAEWMQSLVERLS